MPLPDPLSLPLGWIAALGAGLLVGLDRERRKGHGARRQSAGLRSFVLTALAGALAQSLPSPGLVLVGALAVAALAAISYWRNREPRDADPGLTTELALFVTYMIGALCIVAPVAGGAVGVVVAALLATRSALHRFATQTLTQGELHDLLLFCALALVLLPWAPQAPVDWLGGVRPRSFVALVALLLGVQAAGHVAQRLFGTRNGALIAGLSGGFASSTATVATYGRLARDQAPALRRCAATAIASSVATWVQLLLVLAPLAPAAARALLLPAGAAALLAVAVSLWMVRAADRAIATSAAAPVRPGDGSVLRLREALQIAALIVLIGALANAAQGRLGDGGTLLAAALSGFVDAHAAPVALALKQAASAPSTATLVLASLASIGANTLTRSGVALVMGGPRYAAWVAPVLAAEALLAYALVRLL